MIKLKKDLHLVTNDFWGDLFNDCLDPKTMCKNPKDAKKVMEAIKTINSFKDSCDFQIEGFIE